MEPVKQLTVNGRKYGLRMFSPIEAFDYFHDISHAGVSNGSMKELNRRALAQCTDEMGRSLAETANIEVQFSKHPEDMIALAVQARDELVRPFWPNSGATSASATK